MLLLALGVNTLLELTNVYNEVFAWMVAGIAALVFFVTLRIQARVTTAQLGALYALPFAVMVVVALLGTLIS
jgi:hypothetical protein